jgi:hypothetical protein
MSCIARELRFSRDPTQFAASPKLSNVPLGTQILPHRIWIAAKAPRGVSRTVMSVGPLQTLPPELGVPLLLASGS